MGTLCVTILTEKYMIGEVLSWINNRHRNMIYNVEESGQDILEEQYASTS